MFATLTLLAVLHTGPIEPPAPAPFEAVLPMPGVLLDTGKTLIRPFTPELKDLWVWVPAAAVTTVAMVYDVPLYHEIHDRWPDPVIDGRRFSYYGSFLGEWYVDAPVFAAIGLLGGKKEQRVARAGLEAMVAVGILSRVMKVAFRLERPSFDGDQKHWFSDRITADSFPSGHEITVMASAAVLAQAYPKLAPLFYALAAYVGIARVQQSTHWVSDVTVGAALGLVMGWGAWKLNEGVVEVGPAQVKDSPGLALRGTF